MRTYDATPQRVVSHPEHAFTDLAQTDHDGAHYVRGLPRALEIGLSEEGALRGRRPGTETPALTHGPRAGPGSTGAPAIDSRPD